MSVRSPIVIASTADCYSAVPRRTSPARMTIGATAGLQPLLCMMSLGSALGIVSAMFAGQKSTYSARLRACLLPFARVTYTSMPPHATTNHSSVSFPTREPNLSKATQPGRNELFEESRGESSGGSPLHEASKWITESDEQLASKMRSREKSSSSLKRMAPVALSTPTTRPSTYSYPYRTKLSTLP